MPRHLHVCNCVRSHLPDVFESRHLDSCCFSLRQPLFPVMQEHALRTGASMTHLLLLAFFIMQVDYGIQSINLTSVDYFVSSVSGSLVEGHVDGKESNARFKSVHGLWVGHDEVLYASDESGTLGSALKC